ncbi:unnamed protein product [Rotaria socialis]|uniref:SAP domain-containing protein n=1 Tax=Rotaria socialis TaxID=392032 RepID=A0A820R036_9BILA|nr:unnamed protein product [Rotaria socialis]CAF3368795.1 unnamed protein product [Rotaria socialis]CAF3545019.1 unnamed protein product [Rotaria socialis]CAF3615089.1 unnamed protein product [Rotaria socialis]CAF3696749.1 unnamed protein product [Rotaria socialis]
MANQSLKRKLDSSTETSSVPSRSQILNEKLSRRPDRHQLIEQGILHDSQCAPSLQHVEHALKRARLADELNIHLLNRPGPLDLIQHNILHLDKNEYPNLEQAIQGGQIPFKPTSLPRRPLIFHEYTGSPSSCKPKVTRIDSLSSSSNVHQIRLAQQQLLLELTSNEQQSSLPSSLVNRKPLEQMTLVELRDVCKHYQIPSSHANKTKLIERIKQAQNKINNEDLSILKVNNSELSNADIIASLEISNVNEDDVEPLSLSELDEILKYFPMNLIDRGGGEEEQSSNVSIDFDFQNPLVDSLAMNNDDLFVQMLLDNDYLPSSSQSTTEPTIDDLFFLDNLPTSSSSSSLPRITSVDEFDAFLRDFTLNISSHQHEVSTPIS